MLRVRFTILLCLLLSTTVFAKAQIQGVRLWNAPDHTRLVFDVDKKIQHRLFTLHNPERLVIDFEQSALKHLPDLKKLSNRHIKSVRYAAQSNGSFRVVLDLHQAVRPMSFMLPPGGQYGHRLVVDLFDKKKTTQAIKTVAKPSPTQTGKGRDVIIAIDAGHGGEDPGATGRHKKKEKHITLAIARELKKLIDREPGMHGVLTRKGDYFVELRERIQLARKFHADFFVSIHADAFKNRKARGSSVFVLSRRGASSEAARWLAAKENAADLVGGVTLDDKDDVLASVLLDLAQSGSLAASIRAASRVQKEMGRIGRLHGKKVQNAGFVVLKSPDIPSILVETGFISNPEEERKLSSSAYQKQVAQAVFKGLRSYFKAEPPPGTRLALMKHQKKPEPVGGKYVIRSGDTLSGIAQRHRVSVAALRSENSITSDRIRVGQVLRIPSS